MRRMLSPRLAPLALALMPLFAAAHGSFELPISRIYGCFKEGPESPKSAACQAAVAAGGTQALYDWNGVNQNPDGRHRDFVPDGQLCSGGKSLFKGMDLPRADWPSTPVAADANGNLEFVYNAAAPHSTRYFDFYITRDGYDPTKPLKWSDLEAQPFCRVTTVKLENGRYKMSCPLPKNKNGRHVIYNIWQRSDSAEAFYACMDVSFNGAVVSNWKEAGQVRAQQNLPVDSKVTLRLFDSGGRDLETHTLTLAAGQGLADLWPQLLGNRVNSASGKVKVGVLDANGNVTAVRSASENRVYVVNGSGNHFQIDITLPPGGTPDPACNGLPSWSTSVTYTGGETVSYNQKAWKAQWWNVGTIPGADQWGPWKLQGNCSTTVTPPTPTPTPTPTPKPNGACAAMWSATTVYDKVGTSVSVSGVNYRNQWWTQGEDPSKSGAWGVWQNLGACKYAS